VNSSLDFFDDLSLVVLGVTSAGEQVEVDHDPTKDRTLAALNT
jgi:hypothetical protein